MNPGSSRNLNLAHHISHKNGQCDKGQATGVAPSISTQRCPWLPAPAFTGDKTEPPGQDAWDRNFEKRICLFFFNCEIKTYINYIFMSSFHFLSQH